MRLIKAHAAGLILAASLCGGAWAAERPAAPQEAMPEAVSDADAPYVPVPFRAQDPAPATPPADAVQASTTAEDPAAPAKAEAPKPAAADEPKPVADAVPVAEAKPAAPARDESPKADAPKPVADAAPAKAEAQKADAPKAEAPKPVADAAPAKAEAPKADAPKPAAAQAAPAGAGKPAASAPEAVSEPPLNDASADANAPLRAADPVAATLWPGGGRLEVVENLRPVEKDGEITAVFAVPEKAENLQIFLEGASLVRWSVSPCSLPASGRLARERQEGADSLRALRERHAALHAEMEVWTKRPVSVSGADLDFLSERVKANVADMLHRLEDLRRQIRDAEELEKRRDALSDRGRRVTLWLDNVSSHVRVRHTYTLPDCGWEPMYSFDARPGVGGAGDVVRVRLDAAVSQHSGMDWKRTRVSLALRDRHGVAPAPVREWIVASAEAVPAQARNAGRAMATGAVPMEASAPVPAARRVSADASGPNALWHVAAPGLPQGRSVIVIREDAWDASLSRVARPSRRGDCPVWLTAAVVPPQAAVWPGARAVFSLDGVPVGESHFQPGAGKTQLFFGVDPRVTLAVKADTARRGEAGIIDRRRQWDWGWTYVVSNGRETPVVVRVERPQPQIVDRDVTVRYDNAPRAEIDAERKCLFWMTSVPADSAVSIRHALSISAPTARKISPVAP